jgi:hypothetical protein
MAVEMILSTNTSSKSAIDMCCLSRSAILLKVDLVNLILIQMRNAVVHNIVTGLLGVESLREENVSDCVPTRHSSPNTNLLVMQRRLVEHIMIVCTPAMLVLTANVPR